jgi:hypothetical protein
MRNYNLNIAGYKIGIESNPDGPELVPSERFLRYITNDTDHDVLIKVHSGNNEVPHTVEKVFSAPYVEEINGIRIKKSDKFWSIFKHDKVLFIQTDFPFSPGSRSAMLKFSLDTKEWDLIFNGTGKSADPMEYPLDGLILYYLTVIHGDIMIHASGLNNAGCGYIFSGISGKGKTTMVKLWDKSGAWIIHDDRLILRNAGKGYIMHNTPVYRNDKPAESPVNRIFIIDHGKKNEIMHVSEATAVSLVMANCIQHNWDPGIIKRLLGSVSALCETVPVARLRFRPERSVIDHILENEQRPE